MATQMQAQMPQMDAEMAKMRKSLAESGMPKAQQDAMMKMMDASRGAMKTVEDVPDADKKAVAPHIERFEALSRNEMRRGR